jgi:hypothetical protein
MIKHIYVISRIFNICICYMKVCFANCTGTPQVMLCVCVFVCICQLHIYIYKRKYIMTLHLLICSSYTMYYSMHRKVLCLQSGPSCPASCMCALWTRHCAIYGNITGFMTSKSENVIDDKMTILITVYI